VTLHICRRRENRAFRTLFWLTMRRVGLGSTGVVAARIVAVGCYQYGSGFLLYSYLNPFIDRFHFRLLSMLGLMIAVRSVGRVRARGSLGKMPRPPHQSLNSLKLV